MAHVYIITKAPRGANHGANYNKGEDTKMSYDQLKDKHAMFQ